MAIYFSVLHYFSRSSKRRLTLVASWLTRVCPENAPLTNPNKRFNPMLNLGGDSGSHRHLFGVQDTTFHIFRNVSLSLICVNLLFSSSLNPEVEPFKSSPVSTVFWLDSIFATGALGVASLFSAMVLEALDFEVFDTLMVI